MSNNYLILSYCPAKNSLKRVDSMHPSNNLRLFPLKRSHFHRSSGLVPKFPHFPLGLHPENTLHKPAHKSASVREDFPSQFALSLAASTPVPVVIQRLQAKAAPVLLPTDVKASELAAIQKILADATPQRYRES